MTQETFDLLDQVHREGLTNAECGFVCDTNTAEYFGTSNEYHGVKCPRVDLSGHWLFIVAKPGTTFSFINVKPTTKTTDPSGLDILLWCLDDE